jgi:hypothetical protein
MFTLSTTSNIFYKTVSSPLLIFTVVSLTLLHSLRPTHENFIQFFTFIMLSYDMGPLHLLLLLPGVLFFLSFPSELLHSSNITSYGKPNALLQVLTVPCAFLSHPWCIAVGNPQGFLLPRLSASQERNLVWLCLVLLPPASSIVARHIQNSTYLLSDYKNKHETKIQLLAYI